MLSIPQNEEFRVRYLLDSMQWKLAVGYYTDYQPRQEYVEAAADPSYLSILATSGSVQ